MQWLKIEDVARICGLTKRTIRYYEEIGIISAPHRSKGGVRLYTENDVETLKKILNIREVLGFSLQELEQFISMRNKMESQCEGYRNSTDQEERRETLIEIDKVIGAQLELLEEKMQKMLRVKADLESAGERVKKAISSMDMNQSKTNKTN